LPRWWRVGQAVSLLEVVPPERLRLCYNSSHLFFSPSIVEGLSLVSIEAMACGLPLVVTDVPGNEDIVRANGCGLIVRCRDVRDMARGLSEIMWDEARRSALGLLSLSSSARYDWREIACQYLSVYQTALRRRGEGLLPST
jgi:glycosyltransferase involved in cell wall biosynthesis